MESGKPRNSIGHDAINNSDNLNEDDTANKRPDQCLVSINVITDVISKEINKALNVLSVDFASRVNLEKLISEKLVNNDTLNLNSSMSSKSSHLLHLKNDIVQNSNVSIISLALRESSERERKKNNLVIFNLPECETGSHLERGENEIKKMELLKIQ